jgi:FHA domain
MLATSETGSARVADPHVAVRPGHGLVGRFADTVIVVASEADESASDELLAAVEAESAAHERPGWELARRVAGLLVAGHLPNFGLVAPVGNVLVILLRGAVHAEVTSPAGALTFSGEQSLTWLDHSVELPVDRIEVSLTLTSLPADPRSDLRAGRVPGDGFVLTFGPTAPAHRAAPAATIATPATPAAVAPTATPATPAAPAVAATPATPAAPAVAATPAVAAAPAAVAPTPAPSDADTPAEPLPEPTPVSPRATMPTRAVSFSPPQAETVVHSIQVGALVADDGSRIPLDRSYVLGREPYHDPSVEAGSASPIVVHDADSLISRVQVYVSVKADAVTVRDAESANGTFIAAAGAPEWTKLDDQETPLPEGWSLRIGKRIFSHVGPAS